MKDQNKTVIKTIELLQLFEIHEELSPHEMIELTGIPKTTIHRMIQSLEELNFLKRNGHGKLELGLAFLKFGNLVKERLNIRKIAIPFMEQLKQQTGDAVNFVMRDGHFCLYVEKIETSEPVRVHTKIGRKAPLYAGACPRILLSFLPEAERDQYIRTVNLHAFASGTITDREELERVVKESFHNGFAISHSELEDYSSAIACPIFDDQNNIVAGISIAGAEGRYRQERYLTQVIPLVKKTAAEISKQLGWNPPTPNDPLS